MSEKIKVSYEEMKRLIVSETRLEDENQKLKERVEILEGLYKFKCEEAEKLKEELDGWTLVEDDDEEEVLIVD
ncbi:hypothetical protein [Staphylococcus pseudintermedius]|uniref:hypothetical protein n=1 Tax=Staphylococcus pseudintermedius TaxID=283734 RepID=UPI000BBB8C43|nr:hypothetical protein [Staphylococcus pseudintermedius]MDU9262160.1 hypothetical protein [Staphylococcus pseudintermedius]PCE56534.1 hypothetical protein BSR35_07780 [Staphylococcus pseudintermedius]PWZ88533.1 hypothetical protein DD879_07135 [Staphylococcus pseudintermedius]QDX53355.1 hypothetical protein DNH96_11035 [Staphylococcus pseudintermedius]HAR6276285.1 hypothetical protein [Staphylococcus pseudintermedius]